MLSWDYQIRNGRADSSQKHNSVSRLYSGTQLLRIFEQPPSLDMENPELVILSFDSIVEVLYLQGFCSRVQHSAHTPLLAVEEGTLGQFCSGGRGFCLYVEVDALLHGHLVVSLGRLLEGCSGLYACDSG